MQGTESRWFVLRCQPLKRQLATFHLTRQSFETYCPFATIESFSAGRISVKREPLFGNYLLIKFAPIASAWRAINGTFGVDRLISSTSETAPSPLPRGVVEDLKEREESGEFRTEYHRQKFTRNDRVKVRFGEMVDCIGIVQWTQRERVCFLLDLLGQKVVVTAPRHALALAASQTERAAVR